jgi:hypothetical protein
VVAQPVRTARIMVTSVARDAQDRDIFLAQTMNYKGTTDFTYTRLPVPDSDRQYAVFNERDYRPDAEWVVLDLAANTCRVFDLPGFHSGLAVTAPNGRVFFFADFMQVYYYEPADGTMKVFGEISRWVPYDNDRSFYKAQLGADGLIYAATQAYGGKTGIIQIDPVKLTFKHFKDVGAERPKGLTYGYYLALQVPWVYVAVGQDHWELMALNVATGEQKLLGERTGPGARITVNENGGPVRAGFSGGEKNESFWCVDGALHPVVAGQPAPASTAPALPPLPPLAARAELDQTRAPIIGHDGTATVWWRPAKDQGDWRQAQFAIKRAEPTQIESLAAMPDGTLLGNAYSYNGWFRYTPASRQAEFLVKLGPSGVKSCLVNGLFYFAGYPNTHLSVYDTARPFVIAKPDKLTDPANNPRQIGSFGQGVTEAHYARYLLPGPNGRIYVVGKRERWSTGTGLGYYDPATNQRIGLGQDMKDYYSSGAVLLPQRGRIILSGKSEQASDQFRVYDLDLKPQAPLTLKPGQAATGMIQHLGHESRFLGLIGEKEKDILYLYDVDTQQPVVWQELPKPAEVPPPPGMGESWAASRGLNVRIAFQRPSDQTWWMLRGTTLCQLNPETLALTPVATLKQPLALPVWVGQELYGVSAGDLLKAAPAKP